MVGSASSGGTVAPKIMIVEDEVIFAEDLKDIGVEVEMEMKDGAAWTKDMDTFNFKMTWAPWGAIVHRDPEEVVVIQLVRAMEGLDDLLLKPFIDLHVFHELYFRRRAGNLATDPFDDPQGGQSFD